MTTPAHRSPPRRMTPRLILAAMLAMSMPLAPAPAFAEVSGPGLHHRWIMRGQVLSVDRAKGIICIGKRDNARAGDVLTVIRQTPVTTGGPRASGFRPVTVGQVRLTRIVDDHYSEFEVLDGDPRVNDTVELERR